MHAICLHLHCKDWYLLKIPVLMKHRFFLLITLLIYLGTFSEVLCQGEPEEGMYTVENESEEYSDYETRAKFADASYFAMIPVQTFGDIMNRDLHGFSLSYLQERKNSDYNFWGVELSYNHIGSDRNSFVGTGYNGPFDIEELTGSNLWSVHFLYRVYPDFFFWRIEPYVEVALGTNMFFTTTSTTYSTSTAATTATSLVDQCITNKQFRF